MTRDHADTQRQFLIDCHRFLATYRIMKAEALQVTDGDIAGAQRLVLERIQTDAALILQLEDLADHARDVPESRYTRLFTKILGGDQ